MVLLFCSIHAYHVVFHVVVVDVFILFNVTYVAQIRYLLGL